MKIRMFFYEMFLVKHEIMQVQDYPYPLDL